MVADVTLTWRVSHTQTTLALRGIWNTDKASQLMGWTLRQSHLERRDVLPLMAMDTVSKPRQIANTGK